MGVPFEFRKMGDCWVEMANEGAPSNRHPPLAMAERRECLFIGFGCHAQSRVPVAQLSRCHVP